MDEFARRLAKALDDQVTKLRVEDNELERRHIAELTGETPSSITGTPQHTVLSGDEPALEGKQIRPNPHNHTPPQVIKPGPSPVPGGMPGIYSNSPTHYQAPASETKPELHAGPPEVTLHRYDRAGNRHENGIRPLYRMAADLEAEQQSPQQSRFEALLDRMTPEERAKIEYEHAQREAARKHALAEALQQKSDAIEILEHKIQSRQTL